MIYYLILLQLLDYMIFFLNNCSICNAQDRVSAATNHQHTTDKSEEPQVNTHTHVHSCCCFFDAQLSNCCSAPTPQLHRQQTIAQSQTYCRHHRATASRSVISIFANIHSSSVAERPGRPCRKVSPEPKGESAVVHRKFCACVRTCMCDEWWSRKEDFCHTKFSFFSSKLIVSVLVSTLLILPES